VSFVFKLGFQLSELKLSDQDAKKDGSIEVGEALAAGGRTAVANKQARSRISSRSRKSSEKSERRVSFVRNSPFYKLASTTQPKSARIPRATDDNHNKGVGCSRKHYISRWIVKGLFPNSEGDCGSPLSPISLHGFRFLFRCSSQARNRKTLRQVHSRRIAKGRIDEAGLGAIDRHKSGASHKPPSRTNVYVNPNYKQPPRSAQVPSRPAPYHRPAPIKNTGEKRDVVLNGVAFQSSGRSLVRKDREYTLGKCGLLVSLNHASVPQPTRPAPRPLSSVTSSPSLGIQPDPDRTDNEPALDAT
jgi:hypothetical protein